MNPPQLQLFEESALRPVAQDEIEWLVGILAGKDWMRAEAILQAEGLPVNETSKRRIRRLASESRGRIGSGQLGYKLIREMTAEEFGHFDRWMAHQEAEMQRRRLEASRVFHSSTASNRISQLGGHNGN